METFDQFEQRALAEKRIDYDGVFGYQCVDLILQYAADCEGVRGERGNAIDYWTNTSPVLLTKFTKIASQDVQRGDIVVINGLPGNPFGHVMIGTGNATGSTFEGLEQNGSTGNGGGQGGDAIRTRVVSKNRIAGLLRPTANIAAAVAPVSAEPAAPSTEGYDVVAEINGYTTANNAANHTGNAVAVHPGHYHIFNQYKNMVNVTTQVGTAGDWINPDDNHASAAPAPTAGPDYDGHSITVQPGWGLSHVAEAAGWPDAGQPARWQAIASMNGSNDWQSFNAALKAGQRIAVGQYQAPAAPEAPAAPPTPPAPAKQANIQYSKWEGPTQFVTNKLPTHKWSLNFVNDTEAHSAVDLPEGAPVVVYGKAQRTDGDKPVYLMTQEDFGQADETGTPSNNVGINIVDLSPAPAPSTPATPTPPATPAAHVDGEAETIPVKVIHWQDTINTNGYPIKDEVVDNTLVHDLEGKLGDQQLVKGQPITIAGDQTVNGVKYGFTPHSLENKTYYGVPLTALKALSVANEEDAIFAGLIDEIEAEGKKVASAVRANGLVNRLKIHRK